MGNIRNQYIIAIICGGLLAGTIDIGAAAWIYHANPVLILHSIASGILGRASFQQGIPAALLGFGLQWAMSLLIAAVYVIATRKADIFNKHWIFAGIGYGVVIFAVMNYLVVPFSAARKGVHFPHFSTGKFIENLLAMILFGLIVAYMTRYFTSNDTHRQ